MLASLLLTFEIALAAATFDYSRIIEAEIESWEFPTLSFPQDPLTLPKSLFPLPAAAQSLEGVKNKEDIRKLSRVCVVLFVKNDAELDSMLPSISKAQWSLKVKKMLVFDVKKHIKGKVKMDEMKEFFLYLVERVDR